MEWLSFSAGFPPLRKTIRTQLVPPPPYESGCQHSDCPRELGQPRTVLDDGEQGRTARDLGEQHHHAPELLEAILASVAEGILVLDMQGNHAYVNPAAAAILGHAPEELIGRHSHSTWHHTRWDGSPYPADECPIYAVRSDGEIRRGSDEPFSRSDGTRFPAEFVSAPIMDAGEIVGAVVAFRDVTERKRVEDELRFRNAILSTQQEASIDGLLVVDEDGRIVSHNTRFAEMWDIPAQVLGTRSDKAALNAVLDRLVDGPEFLRKVGYLYAHRDETSSDEILLRDGRVFDRYSAPLLGKDGVYYGRLWTFRDVTERKLAEGKVLEQARILEAILASSPVGIALVCDRVLLWANETLCRMVGVPAGELVGDCTRQLHPDAAEWERVGRELYSDTAPSGIGETRAVITRRDGSSFDCHLTARLLVADDPSQGHIVVLSDVTDLRRAEEGERLAAVGQLAAGVAHDFGNLLAVMRLSAQCVQDHPSEGGEKLVDAVMKATARGITLTDELMAVACVRETVTEVTWIESVVEAILTVTKQQLLCSEVQVLRQYQPDGWPVAVDQAQMGRIFLNLIINACQAMPQGGTLTVATRYAPPASRIGEVVVAFTDTGIGIAPEHLPHVFEPFFTTKGESGDDGVPGTGLGLSVSQRVVTAHGGTMSVRSEVGVGTTFEVHLPIATDAAAPTTRAAAISLLPVPVNEDRNV